MKGLIIILMLCLPAVGFSQLLGIKGGMVFSKMDLSINDDKKFLSSSVFGLVYTQEIRKFRIFIEPSYATKGNVGDIALYDASGNAIRTEELRYKFGYLEIPIMFGFNIINKDVFIGVNAGAAPELLINTKINSTSIDMEQSNTNMFGMDLIIGGYAGYQLADNINAILHFRYGKGIVSPIQDEDETYHYFSPFVTLNYKF